MMLIAFLDLIDSEEDKEKFIRLYNKYVRLVYWVANNRVHKHEVAEECVQETFLSIARNFHKIGEVDDKMTKSYVATIAEGFAIKAYNKEHKAVFVQAEEEEIQRTLADKAPDFKPDKVEAMDLSYAIDNLLDDEERNLVYLKYTYKYKVSEIARMYETTDYFIKKKLNTAIEKLKEYVDKEE